MNMNSINCSKWGVVVTAVASLMAACVSPKRSPTGQTVQWAIKVHETKPDTYEIALKQDAKVLSKAGEDDQWTRSTNSPWQVINTNLYEGVRSLVDTEGSKVGRCEVTVVKGVLKSDRWTELRVMSNSSSTEPQVVTCNVHGEQVSLVVSNDIVVCKCRILPKSEPRLVVGLIVHREGDAMPCVMPFEVECSANTWVKVAEHSECEHRDGPEWRLDSVHNFAR